jgi:hypothetical protein
MTDQKDKERSEKVRKMEKVYTQAKMVNKKFRSLKIT